jgi:hypothetical protein
MSTGVTPPTPPDRLLSCLEPADVLLVEGSSMISTAIKYLTQTTWSHAALYMGTHAKGRLAGSAQRFIEADLVEGVRAVGIEVFAGMPTRICRPVGLSEEEHRAVTSFAIAHLGHRYDLKNVVDLARYLLPTPPVPTQLRRRMIGFGSGDPTRAICSTLIAQAFQSVHYPVLPAIEYRAAALQKRDVRTMSAFPLIATTSRMRRHIAKVPRANICQSVRNSPATIYAAAARARGFRTYSLRTLSDASTSTSDTS